MAQDSQAHKEVALLLTTLDKTIRQFSLYGEQHPQFSSALKELSDRATQCLASCGNIQLKVRPRSLELDEQPLFTLDKRENNYLQEMYLDGIRQIEFIAGVSRKDMNTKKNQDVAVCT